MWGQILALAKIRKTRKDRDMQLLFGGKHLAIIPLPTPFHSVCLLTKDIGSQSWFCFGSKEYLGRKQKLILEKYRDESVFGNVTRVIKK